jgi:hypothetical protein
VTRADACSCGETADHEIGRRTTEDGKRLEFWSSGEITSRGIAISGIGRGRSAHARRKRRRAAEVIMDCAWLLDSEEVLRAYQIALAQVTADLRSAGVDDGSIGRLSRVTMLLLHERTGLM